MVQSIPSLHVTVVFVSVHALVPLQALVTQGLVLVQVIAVPPHTPAVQTSEKVQGLPSSHVVVLGAFGFVHTPVVVLHTPATWH